jgi:hypothetical protein
MAGSLAPAIPSHAHTFGIANRERGQA